MKDRAETLTPNLRFPEFKDGPGWEEKPFANLYAFKPTNTLSRDKLNYEGGTLRNIHYGDIHTRFQALFDINHELVPFVTNGSVDDFDDDAFCGEGDLVFADASEDLSDVGKSIEVVALHGQHVLSGTHTLLATRRGTQLIVGFGGYLFQSERMRQQVKWGAQGSKVYGIVAGRLSNIKVCFPAKEEQRKIAACLTSLDELLAGEGRKHEALRAHRNGLMQQLFPREGEKRPRLRFPEFRDSPEWATKKLADALVFQTGYPFPSAGFNETGDGLRLVRNRDLRTDDKVLYYSSPYDERFVVNNGDVLVGMDGDFTPYAWNKGRALLNQRVGRIVPKGSSDRQFLRYFLTARLKRIEDGTAWTTVKHLSHSDVEKIEGPLPDPAEQRKIAACLTSLDEWISAEGRRVETLRAHRNGLLQQLFPSPDRV